MKKIPLPTRVPRRRRSPLAKAALLAAATLTGLVVLPHRSPAPITIRPGEGATFTAPGQEEVPNAKDAQAQFDTALAKENAGDLSTAVAGYRKTVRRFPKTSIAAAAQFKLGELLEKQGNRMDAFKAYEKLAKDYPRSSDFDKALEGEFRLGTAFLEGARQKVLGVPTLPSMNTAVTIFSSIVRNAPFNRYAAASQFNIGMARERNGELNDAVKAYQTVVDKYPTDPAAADALYQIGFVWMKVSQSGSYDRVATVRARESFEDFLAAYPNNEKAAQARENLTKLGSAQTGGAYRIAEYYYRQKQFKAAIIYYNDVIRQNANSKESEQAKTRLASLRKKFGDAEVAKVLNPPAANAAATAGANGAAPAPAVGDTRLQAQTDTAKRPDYNGPPVSAPAPAPGTVAAGGGPRGPGRSSVPGAAPLTLPPAIPDSLQPTLPAPEATTEAPALTPPAAPGTLNSPTTGPAAPEAQTQPSPAAAPTP